MKRIPSRLVVALMFGLFACLQQAQSQVVATQSIQVTQGTVGPLGRTHVLDGDFVTIKTTNFIPSKCKLAFAVLARQKQFEMAEPSQKFQETDIIVEPGLLLYRLVFAGTDQNRCFIYFEHGGYAHSLYVVVFDSTGQNTVKFLLGDAGITRVADLEHLRSRIDQGEYIGGYRELTQWTLKSMD